MSLRLNIGSGGRRFAAPWINIDKVLSTGPEVCCDGFQLPFKDESAEVVVLWHVAEHFDVGRSDALIRECYRVLQSGGRLVAAVPDARALAVRWLTGALKDGDEEFRLHMYGPYDGYEESRHKQCWSQEGFLRYIAAMAPWSKVEKFGGYEVRPEGTDLNLDFWMASVEAIK